MGTQLKVLGQAAPSAGVSYTIYTVPASTQTTGSSMIVCNRSATATTFNIAIQPGSMALSNQNYIYYNVAIAGYDTFIATIGFSLAATDAVSVYAALATLSFTFFGQEIS